MHLKKSGYFLIVLGVFGMIVSLGADLVGLGKNGIQATQILGAQAGFMLSLAGAALIVRGKGKQLENEKFFTGRKIFTRRMPVLIWVLLGFLTTYILFFIAPMFLDHRLQFQYYYRYLPEGGQIGMDIRTMAKYIGLWLVEGKSPYLDNTIFYPPLYNLIIAPIILVGYPVYYYIMLGLSLASYFLLTFIIPAFLIPRKYFSLSVFFFITGIFSYGLQLELERGQSNIIAFLLCIFAIYIFHYHENYRYFAYLLFSFAIQLKVFPLIFIVMFIKDWRDWKNNIYRMMGLVTFNFALLFVLGVSIFQDFINSILVQVALEGTYNWIGNHSIKAFVYMLTKDGFGLFSESSLIWLRQNSGLLEKGLLLYFAVCFLSIIIAAWLRKEKGLNVHLLLACTIGAMVIPAVSHDYKLAILAAPMAISFGNLQIPQGRLRQGVLFFLVFIAAFAYSATLYPFKYRPDYLANSLPLLMVILTAVTIAYHLNDRRADSPDESMVQKSVTI